MRRIVSNIARLLLPANPAFDVLRILVVSAAIGLLLLFIGQFYISGGAAEYAAWADALVTGADLRQIPSLAWRDIGYPFVLLLSLYPWTHSLIGLAILNTSFGIAIPVLCYLALRPWFPRAAYYSVMAMALSMSPFLMIKYVHHDQPFIFLLVFTAWLFNRQVRESRPIHLYGLALSTFAMSLVRLIGKSVFPLLLLLLALFSRKHLKHIAGAALLFILMQAGYSYHRAKALGPVRSIWGAQLFANAYLNMKDHGLSLSPDHGPNTRLLIRQLHAALLPSPAESPSVARTPSPEFRKEHFTKYSIDELLHRLLNDPNKDYFSYIYRQVDDHVLFGACIEMFMAHPRYVLSYVSRNAFLLLYNPGYRYPDRSTAGMVKEGIHFPFGERAGIGLGSNISELLPEPALSEARHLPQLRLPAFMIDFFFGLETRWAQLYHPITRVLFALMVVAWISTILGLLAWLWPTAASRWLAALFLSEQVIPATAGVSILLLTNVGFTALLVDSLYRFDFSILPLKFMLAGVGGAIVIHLVARAISALLRQPQQEQARTNSAALQENSAAALWVQQHSRLCILAAMAGIGVSFTVWGIQLTNAIAAPREGSIHIRGATYRPACEATANNHLQLVTSTCSGRRSCNYVLDNRTFPWPARQCDKRSDLDIQWACSATGPLQTRTWQAPRNMDVLHISCP